MDEKVADRGSQRFFQAGSRAVPGDADRRDDDFHGGGLPWGHGSPLWHAIGFLFLTALLIGSPLLILLMMGKRGDTLLPRMRDWMKANSWMVSKAVIVFFLAIKTIVSA